MKLVTRPSESAVNWNVAPPVPNHAPGTSGDSCQSICANTRAMPARTRSPGPIGGAMSPRSSSE